jgi:hypothetical protein
MARGIATKTPLTYFKLYNVPVAQLFALAKMNGIPISITLKLSILFDRDYAFIFQSILKKIYIYIYCDVLQQLYTCKI